MLFRSSLSSLALKKSELRNSDDYQTFLNKPCKFMFVYDINSNELENPVYLMMQIWNDTLDKWQEVKLYKVNDDVKKFYDKLTSRTIEIVDGDQNYIYTTSNGNEWVLQNRDKVNDVYKESFRKEELEKLEAEIGKENTICKYCNKVKAKTRFRHNRLKCRECEQIGRAHV